jgi:ABC-type glycerol-3-phosphate transport system substrate-binding protein
MIRRHRRLSALAVAVTAVAMGTTAVAGCGAAPSDPGGPQTFSYGYYGNAAQLQVYGNLVKLYEKTHPGVHIDATYDAAAPFLEKLPIQIGGETEPDVVNLAESWYGEIEGTFHPLLNLKPYLSQAGLTSKQFVGGTWAPGELDGGNYGLPNVVYGDAVAINETLFRRYHVPIPTANWTSADFLRDAQKLTHGSGSSKVYGVATPLNPLDIAQLFGGKLFNPKTVKMQATSPAVRKAITFEVGLTTKYGVSPALAVSYAGGGVDPFLTGNSAMDLSYASFDQTPFAAGIGKKFSWTEVPYPKDMHGVLQEDATGIMKGAPNSPAKYQAEFDFVKWLATNPEATAAQGSISLPAYLPAEKQWLAHPPADYAAANRPAIAATIPRSPYDVDGLNYTQVWTMFGNELSGMITGGTGIDAGIRDTQSQGSSILAQ